MFYAPLGVKRTDEDHDDIMNSLLKKEFGLLYQRKTISKFLLDVCKRIVAFTVHGQGVYEMSLCFMITCFPIRG